MLPSVESPVQHWEEFWWFQTSSTLCKLMRGYKKYIYILNFSIKLQHRCSNESRHIPLIQIEMSFFGREWIWANIIAIISWHSCEVETSLQCRQGQNHTNKTCSRSDAAARTKYFWKPFGYLPKALFIRSFCFFAYWEELKKTLFCVFIFSKVLKVEFTKANIQRFADLFHVRKVLMVMLTFTLLKAWVLRKWCIS